LLQVNVRGACEHHTCLLTAKWNQRWMKIMRCTPKEGGTELAARASANHRLSSNITNSLLFASAGWVLSSHKSAPFFFSNKLIPHHGRVSHHPIKGGREFRNRVECS
jgi:hypothetical protein